MDKSSLTPICWSAAAAGLAAHNLIFRHGEWHLRASNVLFTHVGLVATIIILESTLSHVNVSNACSNAGLICFSYLASLFGSMTVYRIFFHRLSNFDGPFLARVSKLWHMCSCIDSRNDLVLERLRKQYGTFVRTGPSEITVFHPEAHQVINGLGTECTKAVWYDLVWEIQSIFSTRDKSRHDERRKAWNQAFTPAALPKYEKDILKYVDKLDKCVQSSGNTPVRANLICYWFGFDVMGDFAFGKSLEMLDKQKWHQAIIWQRNSMEAIGPLSSVPWFGRLAFDNLSKFGPIAEWHRMMGFAWQQMEDRLQMDEARVDVVSHLIEDAKKKGLNDEKKMWLRGDSVTLLVAGSETVAATFVLCLYCLVKYPGEAQKVYHEVKALDTRSHKDLQDAPALNAFIDETMRLYPAIPSLILRRTPRQGVHIADRYIPGDTTVAAPRYSIARLESCFKNANEFIPERWTSRPEMVKDKRAFSPFSLGRYGCVGKPLALMELRLATANLLLKYDIQYASGEDGSRVERDMTDGLTISPGSLDLTFTPRP